MLCETTVTHELYTLIQTKISYTHSNRKSRAFNGSNKKSQIEASHRAFMNNYRFLISIFWLEADFKLVHIIVESMTFINEDSILILSLSWFVRLHRVSSLPFLHFPISFVSTKSLSFTETYGGGGKWNDHRQSIHIHELFSSEIYINWMFVN